MIKRIYKWFKNRVWYDTYWFDENGELYKRHDRNGYGEK